MGSTSSRYHRSGGTHQSSNSRRRVHSQSSHTSTHYSAQHSTGLPSTPSGKSIILMEPSQTITDSLTELATSTASQLDFIWDEIGCTPDERASQISVLLGDFRRLCEEKIAQEKGVAVQYRQTIKEAKEEMKQASKALRISVDPELVKDEIEQSLVDELEMIETTLEALRETAGAAKARLEEFSARILEASKALGTELEDSWLDSDSDLTDVRLEDFRNKVEEMDEAVQVRTAAVVQLLRDCQSLIRELRLDEEMESDLDHRILGSLFEKEGGSVGIVSTFETDTCTGISSTVLDDLTNRVSELNGEKRKRKKVLSEMGAIIGHLWEKLKVPDEEQASFTRSICGLGKDTIEKGEHELVRLQDLKAQMIGKLIFDAREMIKKLWNETNSSEAQKQSFKAANVTDETLFTDDLLDEHDQYVTTLTKRLEQMRPVLKMIEERENIIRERMDYEELQKDSSRLNKRGASKQLQKEEKMNRRIKNTLPKLTKSLSQNLAEWEEQNGEPFMYHGEPYLDIMDKQEEEWLTYKDNETHTKLRKKQEDKQMNSNRAFGVAYQALPGKKSSIEVGRRPLGDSSNTQQRAPSRGRAPEFAGKSRVTGSGGSHRSISVSRRENMMSSRPVTGSGGSNRSISASRRDGMSKAGSRSRSTSASRRQDAIRS
eukprot:scaffold17482_cov52-Attheya_sp.AAC.11